MNGHTSPHTPSPPPPSPPGGFFDSVRRLGIWRSPDRWGGGVAAGVAHRFGLDPLLVRGLFVVVTLFGGLGLVVYGVAWALLPESADGRIHLEQAVRGHVDIALAGAAAVLIVGLSRPVFWWNASWWTVPWVVVLVAIITAVLLTRDRAATPVPPPTEPHYPAAPPRPAYDIPEDTMPLTTDAGTAPGSGGAPEQPTAPLDPPPAGPASTGASAAWDTDPSWTGGGDRSGGGDWTGGGGWTGGPTPPPQGPPPPPPVPGPGSRTTSLVLAVCLLGAAGIALAHYLEVLDANAWLLAGGAVLTVLGLGVLLSGTRGRTQGGLGVLALLLAIVMVPAAAATAALPGFARLGGNATTWAGDPTWVPRTAVDAEAGYTLVAGELVVDLTELDEDATVPVGVTFGNVHLIVPDDADITVNADVGAGEVTGRLDDDWSGPGAPGSTRSETSLSNGVGISTTLRQEGAGPQIVVDAEVSFGQITIEEAP